MKMFWTYACIPETCLWYAVTKDFSVEWISIILFLNLIAIFAISPVVPNQRWFDTSFTVTQLLINKFRFAINFSWTLYAQLNWWNYALIQRNMFVRLSVYMVFKPSFRCHCLHNHGSVSGITVLTVFA